MDMILLQKKCIFIPTPMQTEQEYLAKYLMQHNRALCLPQHKFSLPQAVALAETFAYRLPALEKENGLQEAVGRLFEAVRTKVL
jgi:UDP-N-acetylglucosamine:LPS N-acetylglucosamine transferase